MEKTTIKIYKETNEVAELLCKFSRLTGQRHCSRAMIINRLICDELKKKLAVVKSDARRAEILEIIYKAEDLEDRVRGVAGTNNKK